MMEYLATLSGWDWFAIIMGLIVAPMFFYYNVGGNKK